MVLPKLLWNTKPTVSTFTVGNDVTMALLSPFVTIPESLILIPTSIPLRNASLLLICVDAILLPFLVAGKQKYVKVFDCIPFKECTLHLSSPMTVHTDGEYCGENTTIIYKFFKIFAIFLKLSNESGCLYIVSTFKKLKNLCFWKWHLAYTISRQYTKYNGAVSKNEKTSISESGWLNENNHESKISR